MIHTSTFNVSSFWNKSGPLCLILFYWDCSIKTASSPTQIPEMALMPVTGIIAR